MAQGTDPKTDAPRLAPDGALHFESQAAFVRVFDGFLSKGGLPVKPDAPLEPLSEVTVRFGDGAATCEAQVVMIQNDVTVLRLTESLPPAVKVMVESARNAPPTTSPKNPFATAAPATPKNPFAQAPKPLNDAPAQAKVQFLDDRPTLQEGTLHFSDAAHAKALEKDLLAQYSVKASGEPSDLSQVNLAIGPHRADLAIGCSVTKKSANVVVVQFQDIGSLAGAFRALLTLAERENGNAPAEEVQPHQSDEVEKAEIDGALASFLGVQTPAPVANAPPATTAPASAAPTSAAPTSAAPTSAAPTPAPQTPAPQTPAPVVNPFASAKNAPKPAPDAVKTPKPALVQEQAAQRPEPADEPAPAGVTFVEDRPTLDNKTLFFSDHAHASSLKRDILSTLGVEATGHASGISSVLLAIGPHKADVPLACSIDVKGDGVVDVRFSDIGSLAGAFRTLLPLAEKDAAPSAPVVKPSEAKIQSSESDKAAINDALASFLSGQANGSGPANSAPEAAPAPSAAPQPFDDIFTADAAPQPVAEVPKDLFDVPQTGSEDELAAIVDAFDASPAGVSDILDIQAPSSRQAMDSLEITVFDIEEATADAAVVVEDVPAEASPAPAPAPTTSPPTTSPPTTSPPTTSPPTTSTPTTSTPTTSPPTTSPPVAPSPSTGATLAPCKLVDDTLQFTHASLAEVRNGFETLGMIWARVDNPASIDPHVEQKVRIQVDDRAIDAAMRAVAMPGPPGTCLLRILDVSALGAILDATESAEGGGGQAESNQEVEPTFATLRGTSLAFDDIDVLKAARQKIEASGTLAVKCLTSPPDQITLSANVSGASLGSGWPATCASTAGQATLTFERPGAVLEAMSLFLAAFDDATSSTDEMAAPTLSGHFLNFAHANLARIAASEIEEHQAILVTPTVAVVPDETRSVRFQVAERPLPDEFEIRLQPAHDGKAIAFFDGEAAQEAAKLLHTSIAAPSHTVGISPTEVAEAVLKKTGRVRNPSSAAQLLSIPIAAAPRPSDVQTPSTPLLLRLLMGKSGTIHVRIRQTDSEREVAFDVVEGREIFSSVPIAKLASSLAFQDGTYAIETTEKAQPGQKQMLTVSLIGELLRALIRRVTVDALAAGFPHADESPMLTDRGARLLEAIGLSSTQTRLAKVKLTRKESAADLADGLRVPLLGWELFYVLEIMGGIEWSAPEVVTDVQRKDPLEAEWELLQSRDDFDALGLHWSTSPRHIEPAFEQAKERYGPQSDAAKKRPELAKKILGHLTTAYERLKDPKSRREYRKEAFSLNWTQQSDLMLSHAKLATYRGDMSEARDLLEGILDFQTNAEASALLKKLVKANLV